MFAKILSLLKKPKSTESAREGKQVYGQKDGVEDLCRHLVQMKGPVSLWRLGFTGLERAKQRLGEGGAELGMFVHAVADKVIAQHMGPEDIFTLNDKGDYVIAFSRTPDAIARERATIIAAQIRQRIFSSGQLMEEVDIEKRAVTTARTDFQGMTPSELMAGLMGEVGRAPTGAAKEDRSTATRVLH